MREVFQPSISHLEMVLTRMLDTGGPRPIVLGTPPPKADNEAIRRGTRVHADVFAKLASDRGLDPEKAQLAPACLRLKLWWLLQRMMRETAERLAVEFWPVSVSAMTEEGYLRPEYWAEDATHANAAYGALMLDEYEKRLFTLVGPAGGVTATPPRIDCAGIHSLTLVNSLISSIGSWVSLASDTEPDYRNSDDGKPMAVAELSDRWWVRRTLAV